MIDLHCHLLPGIDDGPTTMEQSVALARAAAASGTQQIVATPHVSARYPNRAQTIARLVQQLAQLVQERGIGIAIHQGAEIAMTQVAELDAGELERLHLGAGPWLLLEPPFAPVAPSLEAIALELMELGHGVVIAHPERCPALHRDLSVLQRLVDAGALCSITASSLTGRFGAHVRRFAHQLLRRQLAHNVASDAHDLHARPPALAQELRQAGCAEIATWLTELVPAAVLCGAAIPPRPQPVQRSGPGILSRLPWP